MEIKYIIGFLISYFGILGTVCSQEDWHFAPKNYSYIETRQTHLGGTGNLIYQYVISEDTLIENIKYQIVKGRNLGRLINFEEIENSITEFVKVGGIRKEMDKVYFRSFGQLDDQYYFALPVNEYFQENQDQIIYDYEAEAGDTLHWAQPTIVHKIDTVILATGEERKRVLFPFPPTDTAGEAFWVEGVTSARGLLGMRIPLQNPGTNPPHYILFCVRDVDNDQNIYYRGYEPYSKYCEWELLVNNESVVINSDVIIYPNPSTSEFRIELTNSSYRISTIDIYDMLGRLIQKETFDIPITEFVSKNKLLPGYYNVFIKLDEGSLVKRKLLIL